jgi:hypothetical protein
MFWRKNINEINGKSGLSSVVSRSSAGVFFQQLIRGRPGHARYARPVCGGGEALGSCTGAAALKKPWINRRAPNAVDRTFGSSSLCWTPPVAE